MERMIHRAVTAAFDRVPRREVTVFDWHSPEGRQFRETVQYALDHGWDITEVGAIIGVRDFSRRWKIIGRGNR
jgi:hypothetical protein